MKTKINNTSFLWAVLLSVLFITGFRQLPVNLTPASFTEKKINENHEANRERVMWKHYSSAYGDFPAPSVGEQVSLLVFDIDSDGTNEIVVAGWGDTSMVWYKNTGDSWEKYLMDRSNSHMAAGGAVYDIDGDGDLDVLQGGSWKSNVVWWWENPYPEYDPQKQWERYIIKNFGSAGHHDQIFGDYDGDGKAELVFNCINKL